MNTRRTKFAILLSLPVVAAVIAAERGGPADKPVDPGKVVMVVGDSTMTAAQFEDFIRSLPPEVQEMARGQARRQIAEDLVKLKLLAAEARKRGLDKTERFRQQMELMRENALAGALIAELQATLVTEEEIADYYQKHKLDYEKVTVRHILAGTGPETGLSEAQAKAKATDIRRRLLAGEDFAALAKAESSDPGSKDEGGELQPFSRGQMLPEFERAAFALKTEEISQPVKTTYGYHVIQLLKREIPPLAEVRDEIVEVLKPSKIDAFVAQLKKQAPPRLDESFFGPPQPERQPSSGQPPAPGSGSSAPSAQP